jgi:hypothetical protein
MQQVVTNSFNEELSLKSLSSFDLVLASSTKQPVKKFTFLLYLRG